MKSPSRSNPKPSDWLSPEDVMKVYSLGKTSVYKLKDYVYWSDQTPFGLRFYQPSIEKYLASGMQGPITERGRKVRG